MEFGFNWTTCGQVNLNFAVCRDAMSRAGSSAIADTCENRIKIDIRKFSDF